MNSRSRRGVLLLIVLALLAMFSMVAVAFVIMTRTDRISAERTRTIDTLVDDPGKTTEQCLNVVLRGTNPNVSNGVPQATGSAITWQSLLEKIYGYETIGSLNSPNSAATMSAIKQVCVPQGKTSGQLIEFALPTTPPVPNTTYLNSTIDPFHCVGCTVTMLTGQCAGMSSRIVGIDPVSPYNVQMLAFEDGLTPARGDQYIVNGFPYGGMGFGYNSSTGSLGELNHSCNMWLALTPNASPAAWGSPQNTAIITGGVNSDYTAPDYADPLLAFAVPYPYPNPTGIRVPIPSLHRSELILHTKALGNANLLRQVMFRPNSLDHPKFTGSNPYFNPTWDGIPYDASGHSVPWQWDVDNDGDGVPDSVWVDPGLPVRFTTEGKPYKALVAILCLDLDGRLNLNAHGSYPQAQKAYYQQLNVQPYSALTNQDVGLGTTPPSLAYLAGPVPGKQSTAPVPLPRGQGTGTAEVNPVGLFRVSGAINWTGYQAVLSGGGGTMGRYGPAVPSGAPNGGALPGINGTGSYLTRNNAFPYYDVVNNTDYWQNLSWQNPVQSIYDAYGSPPDTQGLGVVALDRAGRPLRISFGAHIANGPHDIDLSRNAMHGGEQAPVDNPFGVGEMERILRPFDRDATGLPYRLAYFTTTGGTGSFLIPRRAEFTVESEYVPVASGVLPLSLRTKSGKGLPYNRSSHPVDLLYGYIQINNTGGNPETLAPQLLPWELLQGLKMDINRPFGPGAFSLLNGTAGSMIPGFSRPAAATTNLQYGIPDQPGTTAEHIKQFTNGSGAITNPPPSFNYTADAGAVSKVPVNGTPTPITDSLAARQLYARHLYCLMLLLCDTNAMLTEMQKTNPSCTMDDVTRVIAQWAVNVVAYRDHNNIMIPFPYTTNPFTSNGWNPTNTPLYTVWGCKRPELLITETLAFHDVRTQDLDNEIVNPSKPGANPSRSKPGTTKAAPPNNDPSFNSAYRPQGSLFVELYHPWTLTEPRTTDLGPNPTGGTSGVQLNQQTPAVGGLAPSPVWRLIIVDPSLKQNCVPVPPTPALPPTILGDELPDPDNPVVGSRPIIERAAYFVNVKGMTLAKDSSATYCLSSTNPAANTPIIIPPCGYAVVGSGDSTQQNRTYIGFPSGQTAGSPTSTRMVTLNKADLTTSKPFVVQNTKDTTQAGSVAPAQVVPIDYNYTYNLSQRLSVSEPINGYAPYEKDPKGITVTYTAATGKYSETLDIPVDQVRTLGAYKSLSYNMFNGSPIWQYLDASPQGRTTPAFRIIYLQRLADPTRPYVAESGNNSPNPSNCNPYRTIDAMTVDLTAFNGVATTADPYIVSVHPLPAGAACHFESHQRGDKNYNYSAQNQNTEVDLWKQEPALKAAPAPGATAWQAAGWVGGGAAPSAGMNFAAPLNQSLGFLNNAYGQPTQPVSNSDLSKGDSQYPFNWLNFSYRPFNNVYELLLVPVASSSRLLARSNTLDPRRHFAYVDGAYRSQANQGNSYHPPLVYDPPSGAASSQVPYPHLLNFFESTASSKPGVSAQFQRLFAYVGVPSRFANAQLQINPTAANNTASGVDHFFHVPFNRVSRFREPGRINFNTLASPDVLMGALNMYYPSLVVSSSYQLNPAFWDKFVRSRRGDGDTTLGMSPQATTGGKQTLDYMLRIDLNNPMPSRFMHAYRSPGGATLFAPLASGTSTEPARETDVSLLRGDPDGTSRPLFELDDYLHYIMNNQPAPPVSSPDQFPLACVDYNRNPYFRYQGLQKLGSVMSTHSNVFAIWITVGYFEAIPVANFQNIKDATGQNLVYPDGYQLGQELGSDAGDTVRHRAFYIFDRSIPVGFVRGRDINQDKAILLRRFIE